MSTARLFSTRFVALFVLLFAAMFAVCGVEAQSPSNATSYYLDALNITGGSSATFGSAGIYGTAVDPTGTYMYVGDYTNKEIWQYTISGGTATSAVVWMPNNASTASTTCSTLATTYGSHGDGCPYQDAVGVGPRGLFVDVYGNIIITDYSNKLVHVVYAGGTNNPMAAMIYAANAPLYSTKVNSSTAPIQAGYMYLLAGGASAEPAKGAACNGTSGTTAINAIGDGCQGTQVVLGASGPRSASSDIYGNLYISDWGNNVTRMVVANAMTVQGYSLPAGAIITIGGGATANTTAGVACGAYNGATNSANSLDNVSDGCWGVQATYGSSGTSYHWGVGVDGNANVYVNDGYQTAVSGTGLIRKLTPSALPVSGATVNYTISTVVGMPIGATPANALCTSTSSQDSYGNGCAANSVSLGDPRGIIADAAGNLYFLDYSNGAVRRYDAALGIVTLVAGYKNWAVAASGADCNTIVATGQLATDTKGGNCPGQMVLMSNPNGSLGVDPAGNVYAGDSGNNIVRVLRPNNNFGTVAVGGTAVTKTIDVHYLSNVVPGSLTAPTIQSSSPDFTVALPSGSAGCFTNNVTQNPSTVKYAFNATVTDCVVKVTYSPKAPGLRTATLQAVDSNSNVINLTPGLVGYATGPALTIDPGSVTSYGTGLSAPQGVALDAAGDIFIADTGNNQVVEIPATSTQVTITNTLSSPKGVAVATNGDLYVADSGNNRVVRIPLINGVYTPASLTTVGSGLSAPQSVVFDSLGNLYIADQGNHRVLKVPAANGVPNGSLAAMVYPATTNTSSTPLQLAIDASDNLYIADTGLGNVYVLNTTTLVLTTGPSIASLSIGGLAVDAGQNIFYSNVSGATVSLLHATSYATSTPVVASGGSVTGPHALAVDGMGNLYVADAGSSAVYKYQRTNAAEGFGIVTVGNPSSTKTVYINSTGTSTLSVTGSTATDNTDFTSVGGGTNACSATFPYSFADGTFCTLSTSFDPTTTGALTDTVTVASTAVNATSPSFTLSGTGASSVKANSTTTISFNPTSLSYGTALSATITVTGASGTPSGTVSYTLDGGSATVATLASGSYTASLGVLTAGLHTVAASYSGDSFFNTSAGSNNITIAKTTPTLTFAPSASTQVYGTAIGSGVLDGSGSVAGGVTYTATPNGGSASAITSASILAAGTYTLTATFVPTDTTDYNTPASQTAPYTVTQATPTISWTPSSNTQIFGSAIGSSVLNASSTTAGVITYTATPSGGSAVAITSASILAYGTYTLSATLTPTDGTDYAVVSSPQSFTVTQASSTVTIAASSSSVSSGTAVKLTATVQVNGIAATRGEVRFLDGAKQLPKVQVVGSSPASGQTTGNAVLTIYLGPGSHSLSAKYIGYYGVQSSTTTTPASVSVTGTAGSVTTLSDVSNIGTPQNYDFTTTVTGYGTASESAAVTLVDTTASNTTIGSFTLSGAALTLGVTNSGSITVPTTPGASVTGDFNNDGLPDFVVTSATNNKFYTFMGSNGSPSAVTYNLPTGDIASLIAASDLNGDGNLDLVMAGTGFLVVYKGNGDGTFTQGSLYNYSGTPAAIATGDFNQDGSRDVAVVSTTGVVSVYLGNGDGTLGAATTYTTLSSASGLVATDLTGSNAPSLVVASSSLSKLDVLLNPANGTAVFTLNQTITLGSSPVSVVAGDVNGDGYNDLVIGTGSTTGLVLTNNGSGSLSQSGTVSFAKTVSTVVLSDINNDGTLDVVGVGQDGSNNDWLSVQLGKGDGTFPTALGSIALGTSLTPNAVFATDLNTDGVNDFVVFNAGNATAEAFFTATVATGTITNLGISGTGSHLLVAKYPGDSNYGNSQSSTASVTAHSVSTPTIVWSPAGSIVYGTNLSTILNATTVGSIAGTYAYTATPSGGTASPVTTATVLAAGSYSLGVTFSPTDTVDYNSAAASIGSFTVTKAPATINVASTSKAYGAVLPSFTTTSVTGLVNGDLVGTTLAITLSTTATAASPVTTYPITALASGASAGNYNFTVNNGTLTVNKVGLTVNVANATKLYGAALPTFSATSVTGLVNSDTVGTTITVTFGTAVTTATPIGNSYSIFATVGGTAAGNYTSTVNNGTLSVTVAPASITVNPSSKIYGAALPTFSASSSGLVNGDTIGTTILVNYSTTATSASSVGNYSVAPVVTGTAASNYSFTLNSGTLTVGGIPASITVANSTKVYGAALPTFSATSSGLQNGDTIGTTLLVSYSTTATSSSNIGSYSVTPVVTGTAAGNYNFTLNAGSLSVTTEPLTVTIANASKNYGAALPTFSATPVGLVNGDSIGVTLALNYSTTANPQVAVGTYPITATLSGASSSNYSTTITPGTLTVNTVPLTLSVNSTSRAYGAVNPSFTATASGLVNGDTVGSTITLGYSTTATTTSAPGSYPITAASAGSSSANYSIVLNAGTLTVTQASTTSSISSSVSTTPLGGSVTFTIQVHSTTTGTPTGTVTVYSGTTSVGTGTLSAGNASVTTTTLPSGTDSVTVVYGGDTNFTTSTSSAVAVSVLGTGDFTLTATPSTVNIQQGLTGNVLITLTPINGYTGTVNFSCGNLSANVSCTFTPASLTANGSTATQALLVVNTSSATSMVKPSQPFGMHGMVAAALFLLPVGAWSLLMVVRRKRVNALRHLAVWMLLLAGVAGMSACGGSNSKLAAVGADFVGVTATASTGSVTHTLTVSINIIP